MAPEGVIEVRLVGPQNIETIESVVKASQPLIEQLRYAGKPVLGLIDFSEEGAFSASSNKAAMQALERIPYARVAMFGTNPIIAEVGRIIVSALGKGESTKVFGSRDEAVAWLVNEPVVPSFSAS